MSYPTDPANPTYPAASAPSPRPSTVTVSTYLLWVTAAISLISGLLTISTVGDTMDVYSELYAGSAAEGTEGFLVVASVIGVAINILFAAGLAILGIFNNRGRNGARITTWILGGIALCCSGFGLAGTALTNSLDMGASTGGAASGPSPDEVQAALDRVLPSWYQPLSTTLTVITLLCVLGAVILLALPASNAYFRKPAAGAWHPSQQMPYPGQPAYPTYPPTSGGVPGQPPYPGQPTGQPPYPGQPTGQPPYPGQQPPAAQPPPAPPAPPSSDPWSQPPADEKRPPTDPSS